MFTVGEVTHNICIASYPRSGNTFLRNIFLDLFGIFSWNNYHRYRFLRETLDHPMIKKRDRFFLNDQLYRPEDLLELLPFQVIKTHDLPESNKEFLNTQPFVIYIIRDGRDAVISEAHHRSDIVEPGSSFAENLKEAVEAPGGSHFGGWSHNVKAWLPLADLVIHFEQLISEPELCCRKIASALSLPEPDFSKMPTFESQRSGKSAFITEKRLETYRDTFPKLFFRSGKVGAWRSEMDQAMQQLFVNTHGDLLNELGYNGDIPSELKYRI